MSAKKKSKADKVIAKQEKVVVEKRVVTEEEKKVVAEKAEKKKRRITMRNLAESFKSKPADINGITNPLIDPEQKKSKRALAVAVILEATAIAERKNLSEEVKHILFVESIAASGILYKAEGEYSNELSAANAEADSYARWGQEEAQGDNSYYTNYKDNVEFCRKFSKALTSKIFTELKTAVNI